MRSGTSGDAPLCLASRAGVSRLVAPPDGTPARPRANPSERMLSLETQQQGSRDWLVSLHSHPSVLIHWPCLATGRPLWLDANQWGNPLRFFVLVCFAFTVAAPAKRKWNRFDVNKVGTKQKWIVINYEWQKEFIVLEMSDPCRITEQISNVTSKGPFLSDSNFKP